MMTSENLKLRYIPGCLGFYTGFNDWLISNVNRKWVCSYRREARIVTEVSLYFSANSKGSRRLCDTQQNTLTIFSDLGMSMINISSHLVKTSDSLRELLGLRGKRNKVINHNHSLAACQENVDSAFIYSTSLCMCLHMFTDLFPLLLPNWLI